MALYLSPLAGVGAQLFDNNGVPLSGGLIYTYVAGTSTPLVTYTTPAGTIPNSNPIVLDSSGRPPQEIWLLDNAAYKFVLQTPQFVQIWSYDNIVGINSNFTAFIGEQQTITATAGQTVFNLTTIAYIPGVNNLTVFVNGSNQIVGINYNETSSTSVTFLTGLNVGDVVNFATTVSTTTNASDANAIAYNEGGTGAVTRNVQVKLQESVSVKDFGAVGDGTTDDTAAFAAAIAASKQIYIPIGTYLVSSIVFNTSGLSGVTFTGASTTQTIIKGSASATDLFSVYGTYNQFNVFERFTLDMSLMANVAASRGLYLSRTWGNSFRNVNVKNSGSNAISCYLATGTYTSIFDNCDFGSGAGVVSLQGTNLSDAVTTCTFIGCSFGAMVSNYALGVTVLQPIVQGVLNKFTLTNTVGFSILNGDIEGTGTYLVIGAGVGHLASSNNELAGFTGTYSSGTFVGGYLMDQYGGTPFTLSPNAGTTHNGVITEQSSTLVVTRKVIQNTNVTPQTVDVNIKSGATNQMFSGINSSGDSYIDNRGSGKNVLQVTGTDKLGVSATNQLIIGTATTSTASTGANGATPAQVYGYLSILIGATTYKIPVYNA